MAVETAGGNDYQETVADIEETMGMVPGFFDALDEEDLVHEWPIWKKYGFEETEIPAKYRELIGLAIAANIKCPYCQAFHKAAARLQGATDEELSEVYLLSSWTSRYSAIIHAQDYDMDTFHEELEAIGGHLQEQMKGGTA
ncbi:MAG: carboxymuconolactone decarboxylase family protein [Halobacteriota archaeon]